MALQLQDALNTTLALPELLFVFIWGPRTGFKEIGEPWGLVLMVWRHLPRTRPTVRRAAGWQVPTSSPRGWVLITQLHTTVWELAIKLSRDQARVGDLGVDLRGCWGSLYTWCLPWWKTKERGEELNLFIIMCWSKAHERQAYRGAEARKYGLNLNTPWFWWSWSSSKFPL